MTPSLQIAAVHLRIADLQRSLEFYGHCLGFVTVRQFANGAELAPAADARAILTLTEEKHGRFPPREAAGLFHAALLFPERAALGTWLQFAAERGVDFEGFSDHGVSEAIYLSDPDGNGLEFYADRPREEWPFSDGEVAMITRPLAVRSLLAEASPVRDNPLTRTHWGHLHLRVTDLNRSEAFYRENLGVEVTQRSFPGARFLAADGYHHHLGLNTWGSPRLPQPPDTFGLAEATFVLSDAGAGMPLLDPDGIHVRVQPSGAGA